ncbi:MAG: indolepyruvate oxidoreductase subunit beta family protein [Burkholderiales bacterium]|nr:indolepyruvate oxidoreductase subunit beta family protein [Burkholderiales bacterium]
MAMANRPLCILVCALGGEGGGVLAEWLYSAAVRAGHAAQATSIPGVAQRTGATTYYVEVAPAMAAAGAARPVFSLSPVPGCIDLLVSSELLETVRQAGAGFVSRERTLVVSSTARALTVAEKMALSDGRADSATLVAALQRCSRAVELLDLDALARQAGTVISAVLLGAIAASGVLPLPRSAYKEAIGAAGKGVQASLAGFALAFDTMTARRAQQRQAEAVIGSLVAPPAAAPKPVLAPAELRALARARVAAYQDEAYARLFDERLARLAAAERAGSAASAGSAAPTPIADEAVRWLALWMCFDDIVQVAALKLAASRMARVRREVGAGPGDIVKTFDHFKPGVPELAGLLPAGLAARLVAWDRRRVASGREPWAMPLKLGTHGLVGTLALRFAAAMKGQRRRGHRFAQEQALIERWLAAVERGAREHAALGLELARCGALIKGYGSTNERGKENLLHIVDHLAFDGVHVAERAAAERAAAVRAARLAAVADDAGRALDATLVAHGAPARPPREEVVRWFKRRPAAGATTAGGE